MTTEFKGKLVWVSPKVAYKCYEVPVDPKGKETQKSLQIDEISHQEMGLPLDSLKYKYPYKGTPAEE